MSTFVIVALLVWASMNGYAFWRLGTVGRAVRVPWWVTWLAAVLAVGSFPAGRLLRHQWPELGGFVEVASVNWLGVLLLLCVSFMVVDLLTLGGLVFRSKLVQLRVVGAVGALTLSGAGWVQGHRDPVVKTDEIVLPGLPKERDGLKLLLVTDTHLGRQISRDWIRRLVVKSDALKPDIIAICGDLVDHDVELMRPLAPELRKLTAPLGVWAVLGNHDIYGGAKESTEFMRASGIKVLLDESAEVVPGLRIVGVQDLGVRRQFGQDLAAVKEAMKDVGAKRGKEGVVYLSHTPEQIEAAADAGAGLMLCGHTHGGQIWPFSYLVATRYPTIGGRYEFGDMTLIVSRGAGTWGPRMRLWHPGEVWLITLKAR